MKKNIKVKLSDIIPDLSLQSFRLRKPDQQMCLPVKLINC